MKPIYKKRSFIIYRVRDGHIVYNTEKPFSEGHTHISNINTAKHMINISINKRLPKHLSDYLLESLLRLANDEDFIIEIEKMRKKRKNRKEKGKMDKFIGTKVIVAESMNRGDYNKYRGWQIPADENPADEGYLVKYEDGYVSWSPKATFERAYRAFDGGMNFGHAIELLKMGFKVARKGWNGKGMYIYLVHGYCVDKHQLVNEASQHLPNDEGAMHGTGVAEFLSHIDMRTANGAVCVGWLASQADMLAEDWHVVQ